MADADAFLDLYGNTSLGAIPEAGGAYVDLTFNGGVALTEIGSAYLDVLLNVGAERPPVFYVEIPQTGWGIPCVPSYTAEFYPVDADAYESMELEVTE